MLCNKLLCTVIKGASFKRLFGRLNRLVGRVFAPTVEDWWFEQRSGPAKDWKIGTCCLPG